jgi:hypothetical protein
MPEELFDAIVLAAVLVVAGYLIKIAWSGRT